MTRVIHTGDTHLGYRQYHSPERREDFLAAFRRVVEDAIESDVDALVHAGDLFHDRSPSLVDVHGAIRILRDLREADVPFLAIVGNHERTREGQWLDLFQTLGLATRLGAEPTTVGDVALYGLDFVPRSKREDLTYDFVDHDASFAALVAHGLFTPFNTEWNTKEVLDASPVAFDAVLLGDDHQPDVAQIEGTWVTYCGSTERTSAAERDERGYNIVEFDADRAESADGPSPGAGVSIRRRGVETRPFVCVDVELAEGEGADRVRERLAEESLEDAVVVVGVEGDGEHLKPAHIEEFARERGALVARVTDRRELQDAELDAVHFADPDAAVRERIRALGLSDAALAIDETVRGDVADSNVRARVTERVGELLDEPGALEPGEPIEVEASADPEATGPGNSEVSPDEPAEETDASPEEDAAEVEGIDAGVEATAEEAGEPATDQAEAPATTEDEGQSGPDGTDGEPATAAATGSDGTEVEESTPSDEGAAAASDDEARPDDDRGDGQVTMEDFR